VVNVVKDDGYLESETQRIREIMRFHCGEGVSISIEFLDEIPKTASSKYRFIVSNVGGDGEL